MVYNRKDGWYRKAKQEGFRSRAAYKLEELDRRAQLFTRGDKVLDLGCAPGGWLQFAAKKVGPRGRVVGIDRLEMKPLPELQQVQILLGDITEAESLERLREALGGPADVVLSDMAPDTSGVGFTDHMRSLELVRLAFETSLVLLKPGGTFAAKIFDGPDLEDLVKDIKARFGKTRRIRPEATRKGSRELYLVATRFKPA
ncbi:MAG: RlmE family RNA methyltransferase [Deltaproteobacteria bacterium]|nr:RlmE family RNA methyltransferase [Deltaproteobacteria bacterium]